MAERAAVSNIESDLTQWSAQFDRRLEGLICTGEQGPPLLSEAMRYSLLAPGKRLRPYLVYRSCLLVGGAPEDASHAAAAVECVHAFSLIHDDLPSMDNDSVRRGQPANHVRYGEAVAILAGDALLALAFEILIHAPTPASKTLALVGELARATGRAGMIGGQTQDIHAEADLPNLASLREIHLRKTAALIQASCRMGAICGGGDPSTVDRLGEYGRHLGLCFQLVDDLLDEPSRGKQTASPCVGIAETRGMAHDERTRAVDALAGWGIEADPFRALADFVVQRTY